MYVISTQVAIIFDLDNQIVLSLGEKLKQAQKSYNANIQFLNVPTGAPPEAPRLLFLTPTFNLNIGLNRIDIFISIPDHIKSNIDLCLNYCFNTTIGLSRMLFNNVIRYNWCGIITTINFPDKNKLQPSLKVIEKLLPYIIKIDPKDRELASLNFQIGFKEPPYFKNITLNGYDQFQIQFPMNQKEVSHQMEMNDEMITESGISILVDINNIPQYPKGSFEKDFQNIIEKNKISSQSILEDLNIGGIINVQ
jgi:hypothetical protein